MLRRTNMYMVEDVNSSYSHRGSLHLVPSPFDRLFVSTQSFESVIVCECLSRRLHSWTDIYSTVTQPRSGPELLFFITVFHDPLISSLSLDDCAISRARTDRDISRSVMVEPAPSLLQDLLPEIRNQIYWAAFVQSGNDWP